MEADSGCADDDTCCSSYCVSADLREPDPQKLSPSDGSGNQQQVPSTKFEETKTGDKWKEKQVSSRTPLPIDPYTLD